MLAAQNLLTIPKKNFETRISYNQNITIAWWSYSVYSVFRNSRLIIRNYNIIMPHISKDPLHGVTLKMVLERLVERYGWEELGKDIKIKCFNIKPSIKSSLTFLRKTPWARKKVEEVYVMSVKLEAEEVASGLKNMRDESGQP